MSLYSPRSLYSLPQLGGLREGGLQRTPVFVGGGRLPGLEGVGGLRLRDALRQSHQSCTSKSTTSFVIVCFVLGCCRKKQVCFCFFSHLQDLTDPVMMMFEQPDEEAEEMQEDPRFEVTEAIPDVELFGFKPSTQSIHVLSGAYVYTKSIQVKRVDLGHHSYWDVFLLDISGPFLDNAAFCFSWP